MKVVCAWCNKNLEDKEPLDNNGTSHGICKECLNKEMEKLNK